MLKVPRPNRSSLALCPSHAAMLVGEAQLTKLLQEYLNDRPSSR